LFEVFRDFFGRKGDISISFNSIFNPLSLAKINIFLATSIPLKSIFGSGSVYPSSWALRTILCKLKLLKMKFKLPDKTALISFT
jgi:hypothetical protein